MILRWRTGGPAWLLPSSLTPPTGPVSSLTPRLLVRKGEEALRQVGRAFRPSIAPSTKRTDVGVSPGKLALRQVKSPADDRQHIVEVVRDAARELTYRLHLLGLVKLFLGLETLRDLLRHPLLKSSVQRLQVGLGLPALGKLALRGLEKAGIVDRRCCIAGYSEQSGLVATWNLPVSEEKYPPRTNTDEVGFRGRSGYRG
jgi:hypothetical protein